MTALVMTHDVDPTMAVFRARIAARGLTDVHVVETQRYPGEIGLTVHQVEGQLTGWLHLPEGDVDLSHIRGVWLHRFADSTVLPEAWPADLRRTTLKEAEAVLLGALEALPNVLFVHRGALDRQAQHKLLLHEVARRVGLEVPATFAGTEAATARAFAGGRPLDYKHITAWAPPGWKGAAAVFTNRLRPGHLDDDVGMRLCPVLLQEEIPKHVELRVIIVGRQTFSASVDPHALPGGEVDWRVGRQERADHWQRDALPPEVEARLFDLMDQLGLSYGAADIIRTPDGRHVFLEVNPAGGYLWVDHLYEHAITDAMLDLIRAPAASRPPAFPTAVS